MRITGLRCLCELASAKLNHYSGISPTALTISQYMEFGEIGRENSFYFVRHELLVRFANLIREFSRQQKLCFCDTPAVRSAAKANQRNFESLLPFENAIATTATMDRFNNQLRVILKSHRNVVETISKGFSQFHQFKRINGNSALDAALHTFVDRILLRLIAIRTLQSQYLSTFSMSSNGYCACPNTARAGVMDASCDVLGVIRDAYNTAHDLCEDYYQRVPLLDMNVENERQKVCAPAEPSYLYHIVFELLKNAMRATIDHNSGAYELPSIEVRIQLDDKYLLIKICDQGGGIPSSMINSLFNYTYTTVTPPDTYITPFAGFGTGLPISRLYARYFSGNLFLSSIEGSGTSACIQIKRDPNASKEIVPNLVRLPRLVNRPSNSGDVNTNILSTPLSLTGSIV